MHSFDIIIRGARICDGTGCLSYRADIGIRGDRIAAVGRLAGCGAAHVVDGDGLTAAPGFIDLHNHLDHGILSFPDADSYIMQGVTTSVVGNCGLSMAPVSDEHREELRGYLKPFLGKDSEYSWDWHSISDFFDRVPRTKENMAPLVGQGTLRVAVMGFDPSPADAEQMRRMKELLREEMAAGAFGMSSGLIYPPGSYTSQEEMTELAGVLSEFGGLYTTHLRNEGDRLIQSVEEAVAVGEAAGIPVEISHHKAAGRFNWGKVSATLRIMERARKRGVDAACDVYPYPASATTITSLLPSVYMEGGVEMLLKRLADPVCRDKIRSDIMENRMAEDNIILACGWDKVMIAECPRSPRDEGRMLSEINAERGSDPYYAFFDWLIDVRCEASMIMFSMDEDDVRTVLRSPLSVVISDSWVTAPRAGGKPHPRGYGSFPRFIGRYARDEGMMSIEEAVRKVTSAPAARIGIHDRGLIKTGMFADIVIFDAERIIDRAEYADPHRFPEGIEHVIVNGRFAVRSGKLTDEYPGRRLRKDAPPAAH